MEIIIKFLSYDAKVAITLAAFYSFYYILLRKSTLHSLKRILLLSSIVLSLVLPLCVITIHKPAGFLPADNYNLIGNLAFSKIDQTATSNSAGVPTTPWWQITLATIFFIGMAVVLSRLALSLNSVLRVIRTGVCKKMEDGMELVVNEAVSTPFSWMRYIVTNQEDKDNASVILHEKCHIRLHHSLEILFVNIFSSLQWFNPAIWMLKEELTSIHEYQADEFVLSSGIDRKEYQYLLVRKAGSSKQFSIANSFKNSTLKKRINMMLSGKSSFASGLKALYMIPLIGISLALTAKTSFDQNSNIGTPPDSNKSILEQVVVVGYGDSKPQSNEIFNPSGGKNTLLFYEDGKQFDPASPSGAANANYTDVLPYFKGEKAQSDSLSSNNFSWWINTKVVYPKEAKDKGITGTIWASFCVDTDGSVTDVHILRPSDPILGKEVSDVISSSPKWIPGEHNGQKVKVGFVTHVTFTLR